MHWLFIESKGPAYSKRLYGNICIGNKRKQSYVLVFPVVLFRLFLITNHENILYIQNLKVNVQHSESARSALFTNSFLGPSA